MIFQIAAGIILALFILGIISELGLDGIIALGIVLAVPFLIVYALLY